MESYLHSTVPEARIRNKQWCSSIDTEMLLIWDCPGRSVLGLGRSGTVRSASGMVRDGPESSVLTPCWVRYGPGSVRDGPWRCRGGPGSSVLAPCSSVVLPCWVRVDDVFRPSVISRGTVEACSSRNTPDQEMPRSGMVRVGSSFGVT